MLTTGKRKNQEELMAEKTVTELSDVQKLFLHYLENVKNPAPREVIHDYLFNWGFSISDCQLRTIKRDLIEAGYAIGSSRESGYFIIYEGDDARLEEALEEGRKHIRGNARMNALLKRNVSNPKLKQKPQTQAKQCEMFL